MQPMQTMHTTVSQDLDSKLQATISADAHDRLRVAAAIADVTMGQIITDLAMEHLAPVPKSK